MLQRDIGPKTHTKKERNETFDAVIRVVRQLISTKEIETVAVKSTVLSRPTRQETFCLPCDL